MTILSSSPIMVNPFSTNVPLLYPLKTENFRFSDVFRGYRSGTLVENGLTRNKTMCNTIINGFFTTYYGQSHKIS